MAGFRSDGRGAEEFRSYFINTGVLSQARGSCYLELGGTKVMVGVFGPRQSDRKLGFLETGRLQCEVRLTSFAGGTVGKGPLSPTERSLSAAMVQALEASVQLDKFPKAVLNVQAMVLEAAGSEASALITAASTALADAGIELYEMAAACQVARVGGTLLLDPTKAELAQADAHLLMALLPSSNEVTQLQMGGVWAGQSSKEALELAMGGCSQMREAMKEALIRARSQEGMPES